MKSVLIIGAGFLQSFVIKRAKDLGYKTFAVDGDENAVGFKYADFSECIDIVNEKDCLEYARKNHVDGVLTAATDYGVLTASYIARELNLNGLNYESAKLIKNKYLVRKCLFENRVDDTKQAFEVNSNTEIEALSEKIEYPVMVKPCDGSGSRGAGRVDKAEDLKRACEYAMSGSITNRAEIESFVTGNEYGAEIFVENGNIHVLAVMKKYMTKPPFYAELGHEYPSDLSQETENKVRECVIRAVKALNINFGSVNMDLLISDDNKVHIVDIGARMGGNLIGSHIISLGTGVDYIGNMIKAAVGDETDFKANTKSHVATSLLALSPGKVKALPDFEKIEKEFGVMTEHHLKIGDVINPYRTNLDGCGYVISTENEPHNRTLRALEKINNEIVRE